MTQRMVIVTGAGRGMGTAIARRFLSQGDTVLAVDVDAEALSQMQQQCGQSGHLIPLIADVADPDGARSIARIAATQAGKVDVLVNNAGIYPSRAFEDMSFEEWCHVISVNLHSVFLVTKAIYPLMRSSGAGRIINVGSSSFFSGTANASHYIASKGGIVGFSRSLASEVGAHGITVNVVTPGLTMTDTVLGKTSPALIEMRRRQRPLGRDQVAEDIVGTVLFLASADAGFITGQTINVDGGVIKY